MARSRPAQAELSVLRPQANPNRLIERVLANTHWAAAYRREVAFGQRPDRPPGDGPMRRPGGGLGPGPGGPEEMTLANWIALRMKNVADELAGNRAGTIPRMQRGPGGPAGLNGPRRPGQPQ